MARTPHEMHVYRDLRKQGHTATYAHSIMKDLRDSNRLMLFGKLDHAPFDRNAEAYVIDPADLKAVTGVEVPFGLTPHVFVYDDDTHLIEEFDEECWDPADVAAWKNNEWRFVGVAVVLVDADGEAHPVEAVWGVNQGGYWPGNDESQIWDTVLDMIDQASHEATEAHVRDEFVADQIVKVPLVWDDGTRTWKIDRQAFDGLPLNGLDDVDSDLPPLTRGEHAVMTRARMKALPTGAEITAMLVNHLTERVQ